MLNKEVAFFVTFSSTNISKVFGCNMISCNCISEIILLQTHDQNIELHYHNLITLYGKNEIC